MTKHMTKETAKRIANADELNDFFCDGEYIPAYSFFEYEGVIYQVDDIKEFILDYGRDVWWQTSKSLDSLIVNNLIEQVN